MQQYSQAWDLPTRNTGKILNDSSVCRLISKMTLYLPGLAASLSKPEKLQVQQAMSVFQRVQQAIKS